jgi:hypothetical protein
MILRKTISLGGTPINVVATLDTTFKTLNVEAVTPSRQILALKGVSTSDVNALVDMLQDLNKGIESPLTVSLLISKPTQGSYDGAVTATVTGGVTPYTYTWSNGINTKDIDDVCAGSYSVIISDHFGTQVSATVIVENH